MDEQELQGLAEQLAGCLREQGRSLVTAESCTGGWVAKICTDLPGSSRWFERGFVTYSNEAKQEMLGVQHSVLITEGAVSEAVAGQMATGALQRSRADLALAISGLAGPGGATPFKPVGMVCFAWALRKGGAQVLTRYLQGNRDAIRRQSVLIALQGAIHALADQPEQE